MNEAKLYNMASIIPRTIVITTIPGKRPISALTAVVQRPASVMPMVDNMDIVDDFDVTENGVDLPRKRKRLTHLTSDQRLMRRKLKNRVAAQTARDRKKMRMEELEEAITALEAENKRLQRENTTLKLHTGVLSEENVVLRDQLGQGSSICEDAPSDQEGSLESAAGEDPSCLSGHFQVSDLASNAQSDLIGLLQQIVDSTEADEAEEDNPASFVETRVTPVCTEKTSQVVGPSAAELESIKELIHIDHEYYKVDPSVPCPLPKDVQAENSSFVESRETTQEPDLSIVKSEPCPVAKFSATNCQSENIKDIEPHNISQLDLASFLEENMDSLIELEALLGEGNGQMASDISVNSNDKTLTYNSSPAHFLEDDHAQLSPTQCLADTQSSKLVHLSLSESGYNSEHSDIGSPLSESSTLFDSQDGLWEESFTELFPSLV